MSTRRWAAAAPTRLLAALLPVLLVLLAGCGLEAQRREEPAPLPDALPTPPRPPGTGGGAELVVFFVDGALLAPVPRSVEARRPQDALDQLVAGPTAAEVASGLRTALPPQDLMVLTGHDGGGSVLVTVTRGFTGIAGGNQLLAVAQVVWTVTQFPGIDEVRFVFEGGLVAVPTDEGLTDRPVDRADFTSVAPRPAESPGTPAPTPPTPAPSPPGPPR